jgi:hypothetical protein
VHEELSQPPEQYNCSYFRALYSPTWSPLESTRRNSKIENLPTVRRALHHKLRDRRIHNDAVHRASGTMSHVGYRRGSRPIAATPAMGMTSVFRHDGACALRVGGRDCWFGSPDNSACGTLHGLSIRLTLPANYAPPTASPPTRLKLRATAVATRTCE